MATAVRVTIACYMTISCMYYLYKTGEFDIKKNPLGRNDNETSMMISNVVKGWPPDRSLNISHYIRPKYSTTLIKPTLPLSKNISWRGEIYSKSNILICVQSAVISSERRNLIRRTWAKKQTELPVHIIFVVGRDETGKNQELLEQEANENHDLLQEDFIDTYNNLTLKSMFVLKFVQNLSTDSIKYLMKVDDDSYVNLRRLSEYMAIIDRSCRKNCIIGQVIAENSPVIRPGDEKEFTKKWEVPYYIYSQETFPKAVSGCGYIITKAKIDCIFKSGLQTPYLNLEDIFITGLAASKCDVHLRNSLWFSRWPRNPKQIDRKDLLIHNLKSDDIFLKTHESFQKIYKL